VINVLCDTKLQHLHLLDRNKYNVIDNVKRPDFKYDDDVDETVITIPENTLFIQTREDSRKFSFLKNSINCIREHDLIMLDYAKHYFIIPSYIFCNDVFGYLGCMKPNTNYMLKSFYTARSTGKMYVTDTNMYEAIQDSYSLSYADFNAKWNIDTSTCISEKEIAQCHSVLSTGSNDFYLSEVVDYTAEYRIIYTAGTDYRNYTVCRSHGTKPGSKEKRMYEDIPPNRLDYKLFEGILSIVKDLGDGQECPVLSLDIWYDNTTNRFGLFEYSQEFGFIYGADHYLRLKEQINNTFDMISRKLGFIK